MDGRLAVRRRPATTRRASAGTRAMATLRLAVGDGARQLDHFGYPAAVCLLLELDQERDRHA